MTSADEIILVVAGMWIGSAITLFVCAVVRPSASFWQGYIEGWDVRTWWRLLRGRLSK